MNAEGGEHTMACTKPIPRRPNTLCSVDDAHLHGAATIMLGFECGEFAAVYGWLRAVATGP